MKVHTGNFLDCPDEFDYKFFKVSPREARTMDPQQRILLHTAHDALESAGYVPDATPSFQRDTFGCFIGSATQDHADSLREDIDVHYSTGMSLSRRVTYSDEHSGTLKAFLSGRISYAMQFGGPSVVVDTACSSSVVAIHQACRALMNRDCNAAITGGVNIMSSPNVSITFGGVCSKITIPTDRCLLAWTADTSSAHLASAGPLMHQPMAILGQKDALSLFSNDFQTQLQRTTIFSVSSAVLRLIRVD
jgi:acyl transferase domain-containing protein